MINKITRIFPEAIIEKYPVTNSGFLCYYDDTSKQYIAIPKQSISEREQLLLATVFKQVQSSLSRLNRSPLQEKWYFFLSGDGELPLETEKRVRFIHFIIDYEIDRSDFLEAIHSLVQEGVTTVWLNETSGLFIELETADHFTSADFLSFTEALQSDFYLSTDFYIGRFFPADRKLKERFQREHLYFQLAKKYIPDEHIFTFEKAFPISLVSLDRLKVMEILHEEWTDIFHNNFQLLKTIQLFLENNSNISMTAKKLYLHRNSLQYRIDKFIEQTSIDIKSFHGAISVYFICIFGQSLLRGEISQTDEKLE